MMQVVRGRIIFSSRRLHTRVALVTGVQTCALPIYGPCDARITRNSRLPYWRRRNGRPHPPLRLGCYPAWRSRRMAAIAAFRAQYLPAFQLVTSWPPSSRWPAMGAPMMPRPMNPIFAMTFRSFRLSLCGLFRRGAGGEVGAQPAEAPGGAGLGLVLADDPALVAHEIGRANV